MKFEHEINGKEVELEIEQYHLEDAAREWFDYWVDALNLSTAIGMVCGSFSVEAEKNAVACLMGGRDFFDYLVEDHNFLEKDCVIESAKQRVINIANGV